MAPGDAPVTDPVALAQQVDAALRESAALQAALSRGRSFRLLILLAFAGLVVAILFMTWQVYTKATSPQNLEVYRTRGVEKLLGKNLDALTLFDEEHRADPQEGILTKQVRLLVRHSRPVLVNAFESQVKKDLPGFLKAAEKERLTLSTEMQERLETKLDNQYEKLMDRHQQVLVAEFPEAKDKAVQDRMMANLNKALDRLVRKYYIQEMEKELDKLYSLYDNFEAAPAPGKDDLPLEQQLMSYMLELLKHWLSHPENVDKLTAQR